MAREGSAQLLNKAKNRKVMNFIHNMVIFRKRLQRI